MKQVIVLFAFILTSFMVNAQDTPYSTGNIFKEEIKVSSENKDFERVTKSYLTVDFGAVEKTEQDDIQIYDASGKYIMHQKPKKDLTRVDVSHLASGTYFLHIKTKSGLVVKQISIERDGRESDIIIK